MKKLSATTILLVGMLTASAQNVKILKFEIWDEVKPKYTTTIDTPQGINERGHITNCQTAAVELYLPQGVDIKNTVVICPGGGYGILAIEHEGRQFAKFLSDNGIAVAVLAYRMPNGVHQIPMEDVERTFSILRERSSEWGIDPQKIGIMGFSAGGHLAATASVRMKPDPAFSILFYPVISFQDELTHEGSRQNLTGGDKSLYGYYSNEQHVTHDTPIALIFYSADDKVVVPGNSKAYFEALTDNGCGGNLIELEEGGHGWGFGESFYAHEYVKERLLKWLSER